jgi:hypothetical protein
VNEEQLQEDTAVKNISFGIEGILLGLVFIAVVFLALNYFNIISLPFLPNSSSLN